MPLPESISFWQNSKTKTVHTLWQTGGDDCIFPELPGVMVKSGGSNMLYRPDRKGRPISQLGYGCMRFTRKGSGIDSAWEES